MLCCFMWYHTNTNKDYARKVPVFCNVKSSGTHTNHRALWIINAFPDCGPVKCLLAACLLFCPTFVHNTVPSTNPQRPTLYFSQKVWRIHQYCTWHTKDASTHVYNAPPILVSGSLVQFNHELLLVTRYANLVKHKNHDNCPPPNTHRHTHTHTQHSTDTRRLTTVISSEKCVVRRFSRCANVIECIYTNLNSIAYYTPRLYSIAYCS